MEKIRIGVLCPSEIAFRRFIPALKKTKEFCYEGVSCATHAEWNGGDDPSLVYAEFEKAKRFEDTYGGRLYEGYESMLCDENVDAVYIPLPPALHFKWAKSALEHGKHIFVEKPFTTNLANTMELIELAKTKHLAVHENYMFVYHSQIFFLLEKLREKVIGNIRLIRLAFGFPFRGASDFRYDKALGGGALLDCGGYTVKLSSVLLGDTARVTSSKLNFCDEFDVDVFGTATIVNSEGVTAQLSFGMDNDYKCDIEVWGSEGTLIANRVFTPPSDLSPVIKLHTKNGDKNFDLLPDDSFYNSIQRFYECVTNKNSAEDNMREILFQAKLVNELQIGDQL